MADFIVQHLIYLPIPCVIGYLYWKFSSPHIKFQKYTQEEREKLCKQGFSLKHVPKDLDYIIIGSGMGGLTTGALLAKEGKKVLILEQHDTCGGNTHTFEESGYEFDTGLHYVGGKIGILSSPMRRQFDYITNGNVKWEPLDSTYDVAVVPEEKVNIHSNIKSFIKNLKDQFPDDCEAIDQHFKYVKQIQQLVPVYFFLQMMPRWISSWLQKLLQPRMKLFYQTTQEVLDELTDNVKLKGILSYMYGDYGEIPNRGAFFVNALLWDHFKDGAYYPVGGPAAIPQSIVPIIEDAGGKVLVRAPVSTLLFNEKEQVIGVEVKGKNIYAPIVISSVGAPNTFLKLVPKTHHHLIQTEVEGLANPNIGSSCSLMSMFIGLDIKENDNIVLPKQNLWVFPSWDHNENWKNYEADSTNMPAVFISFSSVKDPSYATRHPNKHVALVIAPSFFHEVEPFSSKRVKHRGQEYIDMKAAWRSALLDIFHKQFPHLKEKIDYMDLGTAVSNDFYLGTYRGAVYGLGHTPERYQQSWLSPKTSIPNLYLTGQDVLSCGIAGAMAGGFLTAMTISKTVLLRTGKLMA